jgi:hypothetical protein
MFLPVRFEVERKMGIGLAGYYFGDFKSLLGC